MYEPEDDLSQMAPGGFSCSFSFCWRVLTSRQVGQIGIDNQLLEASGVKRTQESVAWP